MGNTKVLFQLIRVDRLTKVYASGKIRVKALDEVTLGFEEGLFAAVTGASGSGKSTLLNLLGGLDTPTSGSIEVKGKRISDMGKFELALYRRYGAGMIFQSFYLISSRTALENVELPLVFSGAPKKERGERSKEMLERVGLSHRLGHRPSELSGGEQQRVAIARALVNRPQVLLADEPTGNLDSRISLEIVELLAELNRSQGLTVIMVSHEEALAAEFAKKIIRLQDGRVIAEEERR